MALLAAETQPVRARCASGLLTLLMFFFPVLVIVPLALLFPSMPERGLYGIGVAAFLLDIAAYAYLSGR
jgi:hypothetical protein